VQPLTFTLGVNIVTQHALAIAVFFALGIYNLLIYRGWHNHLIRLAKEHDLPRRRKLATYRTPIVILLLMIPFLSVINWVHDNKAIELWFTAVFLLVALAPSFIYSFRQRPLMKALGYVRPY